MEAVTRCEVGAYRVPTDAPEADGTLAWDATTLVLVTVAAGDIEAVGWTYGSSAAAHLVRATLADLVVGRDVMDVPGAWESMRRALRNDGYPGIGATAVSAVDAALWNLKATLLGLPLCRLLGVVHDEVPVYGSGGFTTYDDAQMTRQLTRWAQELRIPRVKIKIGELWGTDESRDLARVSRARQVVGDGVELYVDANGGYSRKQAVRVAEAMAELDVRWYEEPVSSDDLSGLREVRDRVRCDVTAGEYGYDPVYFRRMCEAGAVDCLQVDMTRCGGVTGFLRAAAVADAFGLEVSAHCAPAQHAHVLAAVPNLRHLEWFHDHERIEAALFDGALDPTGGVVRPDQGRPGVGVTVRVPDAEVRRVA